MIRREPSASEPQEAFSGSALIWPAAIVFTAALVVRLAYAAQVSRCPLFQTPTIDAADYYDLARQFANGHWLQPIAEPYWQPPFYSAALAVWMKLAGTSVATAKNAQFVLGSVNCVLTLVLGTRVFGRTIGLVAGLASALYAPMIYFDGELLTPTLQIFLNLLAILALSSALEKRAILLFAAAGLLLGLSLIVRPDVLVFVAASAIWIVISFRGRASARWFAAAGALVIICAGIPVIPVAIRNRVIGKDSVLISSNGGLNFYIGNNARYDRTVATRPGPDWDSMLTLATRKNPDAKLSEQSAFFYRKAFQWILRNPAAWAGLMFKKAIIYITAVEGRRNHDLYFYRRYSSLYPILLFKTRLFAFPLGIVLPLGILGLVSHKRGRGSGLLMWYLAAQFAATVAFFPCARYRVTSAPVILIFAARGAFELWRMGKERTWRKSVLPLAVAAAALVVSNANFYGIDRRQRLIDAETHYLIAEVLFKHSDREGAVRECGKSIALDPTYEACRLNYSRVLCSIGRPDLAKRELLESLRIRPNSAASHAALGELLAREGDLANATAHLEAAARADPIFADRLARLAEEAFVERDYAAAERALRALVASDPGHSEARRSLGVVLMERGKLEESIAELRKACRLAPDSADCYLALGLAYRRSGQTEASREAFKKAIAIGPAKEVGAKIRRALNARAERGQR